MSKRLRRLADYALARLSEASTVRSLLRLASLAAGISAETPDRAALITGAGLAVAELVGVLMPDYVRRGKKQLERSNAKNPESPRPF